MLKDIIKNFRHSLIPKLIFLVGIILLIFIATWAYFNIKYKEKIMEHIMAGIDRLSNTIKLGTHYAMMLNSRDDINQIINNIAKQKEIENIRIYNKEGQIKFSNRPSEVEQFTNIKAEACDICHGTDPPLSELSLEKRRRIFFSPKGYRLLGIISPIYNEPSCATDVCHVHPGGKKILGALDMVVSLEQTDRDILHFERWIVALMIVVFVAISGIIFIVMFKFVRQPITKLIEGTRRIAKGDYFTKVDIEGKEDEMGQLAAAINLMGKEIGEKQVELNKQKEEYRQLFEVVPCYITVQDRDYTLIRYNCQFARKFKPKPGDKCFYAYKGLNAKCENCPVERTFENGKLNYSEETGYKKDGTVVHWMVVASPIRDAEGNIVAAMEMGLDITHRKLLEEKLEKSEKKYHAIFSNIPNPVFVLDVHTLRILDCNESVKNIYGYDKYELINESFSDLFKPEERDHYAFKIVTSPSLTRVTHLHKNGKKLFVNIRISPSEYGGQKVFLVTSSDITKRLEAEQQLIQASKMATLGEMATGVAHELNQPLSVIKTASSFFMKKIRRNEKIKDDILLTMASEIDSHVDRATKIINHMREFGRKSDMELEKTQINEVMHKAFEIFSQQLKLRGIEVVWELEENLPLVIADPGRMEQVFINLLINARDAIEDRWEMFSKTNENNEMRERAKRIYLRTRSENRAIVIEVEDTGKGIPPEILDKIFEPFFTTKDVGKGTGLGLSISYGIVTDCGGAISASSDKEKGACFTIRFPLQGQAAASPNP
ncbi:MAG: PAS domain-containing sensor histidine kinase [Desulfobacteraceae bacterium IS3]|nr:MAG: PAS domain-containing sensor histidine kinase [Desulfobacteraceae bacterium IS3]